MRQRIRLVVYAAIAAGALLIPRSDARAIDLHAYWDQRCAECHGHAGAFARRHLTVKNGQLVGSRQGDALRVFLSNHHLAGNLVEPVYAMLLAQAITAPRFQAQCGKCHQTAAALARNFLTIRDGVLVGRTSGRRMSEFLNGHGGSKPDEAAFFLEVLTRVTREVQAN